MTSSTPTLPFDPLPQWNLPLQAVYEPWIPTQALPLQYIAGRAYAKQDEAFARRVARYRNYLTGLWPTPGPSLRPEWKNTLAMSVAMIELQHYCAGGFPIGT